MIRNIHRAVWLLLFISACGTANTQRAFEQPSIASNLAEYELSKTFGDDVIRELSQALPPRLRADFVAFLNRPEHKQAMIRAVASALADTFTSEEIQAMLDFNSSPLGKSINSKQALYTRRSLAAMNNEVKPLFDKFMNSRK